jgi:sulfonate transport system substrate-binding protein
MARRLTIVSGKRPVLVLLLVWAIFAQPAAAADPAIRFAYQPSVAGAAMMVAASEGFFAAEGLKVESKLLASGPVVNEALVSGSAEFGVMGDVPSVIAVATGLPLRIVATIGGGAARERVMVPRDSAIQSVRELAGKKVAITLGSSAQAGWYRLAEMYGISVQQVKLINMQPNDMVEALATRQVDAAVLWEPTPTIMEARGVGRELANLSIVGNTFPYQLLVSSRFAAQRPDLVERVLKALLVGTAFIRENLESAAVTVAKVTGLDPALALRSMSYHFYEVGLPPATYESLQTTAEFLLEYKSIKRLPDWNKVIDRSFLERLSAL